MPLWSDIMADQDGMKSSNGYYIDRETL